MAATEGDAETSVDVKTTDVAVNVKTADEAEIKERK